MRSGRRCCSRTSAPPGRSCEVRPWRAASAPADAPSIAQDVLSEAAREERRLALQQVETLCLEATDLSFPALARGTDPPRLRLPLPLPGPLPFPLENREFFFGREALVAACKSALTEHPHHGHPGPLRQWQVLPRPGRTGARPASARPDTAWPTCAPAPPPRSSCRAFSGGRPGPLIVVADQFEELFTHTQDEAQRTAFLDLILAPVPDRLVVLTMRADFLGECARTPPCGKRFRPTKS